MSKAPFRPLPGRDIRTLPKVRVLGFEKHPELAQRLVDRFSGSLTQFYHSQAQNRDIGDLSQAKKTVDRGDHRMLYLHQFGEELLVLQVAPEVVEQVKEEPEKKSPWDWAVIDFTSVLREQHFENGDYTVWLGQIENLYARCVAPEPKERHPVVDDDIENGACWTQDSKRWSADVGYDPDFDGGTFNNPDWVPFMALPLSLVFEDVIKLDDYINKKSLRLDLRNYHEFDDLVFEIYASSGYYEDVVYTTTGKYQAAHIRGAPQFAGSPNSHELRVQAGYDVDKVYELFPNIASMEKTVTTGVTFDARFFGKSESEAATYTFTPYYDGAIHDDGYNGITSTNLGTYFFLLEASNYTGWDGTSPDSTPSGTKTIPEVQPYYQPAQEGETQNAAAPSDMGVGIYKWQNTAWARFAPAMTGVDPTLNEAPSLGVMPDPPNPPGLDISGHPQGSGHNDYSESTNFIVWYQWEWFIFLPITEPTPIRINSDVPLKVEAQLFKGTPDWVEQGYSDPYGRSQLGFEDLSTWVQWNVKDQNPRFKMQTIAETTLKGRYHNEDEGLVDDYVQEQQWHGYKFLGHLHVSPKHGVASFKPVE